MRCQCGGKVRIYETRVRDSKPHRRRKCDDCKDEYWTVEIRLSAVHIEEERLRKEAQKIARRIEHNKLQLRVLQNQRAAR